MLTPTTPEELAEALGSAASRGESISLEGAGSKRGMAGPVMPAAAAVSTAGLRRILRYEPNDLTISVEAGLPWSELSRALAGHRQMVPLDPPFSGAATVGGVVAANSSGPRRRLYGTARDLVIGMQFATLEGKLVQSGGMVVKNVAGLDMAKLLIGSFGTLAAIAVVNFKLAPLPGRERSFLLRFPDLAGAMAARDAVLQGVLQPAALDLLTPEAAEAFGGGFILAVRTGGNQAVVERSGREIAALAPAEVLEGAAQDDWWRYVEEFTPHYLAAHAGGAVVRVSCALKEVGNVLAWREGPWVARAGTGLCYGYFPAPEPACAAAAEAARRGWKAVVEFAPGEARGACCLWPSPGSDFAVMTRVKHMFDPQGLLNRGRLYGRI